MIVPVPNKKDFSLKNVEWGSKEFIELMKQAEKQREEWYEYEQAIESVRKVMEGY